jgi:hypothetical protein
MDNKLKILYEICLNQKNIESILDSIKKQIKLSEKSVPKCVELIKDILVKRINTLVKAPRDKEEAKKFIIYLRNDCVETILEIIAKKYPNKNIGKRLERDIGTFGNRQIPRQYQQQQTVFQPVSMGNSNYAPAFEECSITGSFPEARTQTFDPRKMGSEAMDASYQQMINERNYGMNGNQRPQTPDFSLDGSGKRKKQEEYQNNNINIGFAASNDYSTTATYSNPYEMLLGGGSPNQNPSQTSYEQKLAERNTLDYEKGFVNHGQQQNGFNQQQNGFNPPQNGFNGQPNGFNPPQNGFNGQPNGLNGQPINFNLPQIKF